MHTICAAWDSISMDYAMWHKNQFSRAQNNKPLNVVCAVRDELQSLIFTRGKRPQMKQTTGTILWLLVSLVLF